MSTIQKLFTVNNNGILTYSSKLGDRALSGKLRPRAFINKCNTYREHELFNVLKDHLAQTPAYDYNDLPLAEHLQPLLQKTNNILNTHFVDSTPLEAATILGTNRKIYRESIYCNPCLGNDLIEEYLDEGFTFQEVANIFYKANKHFDRAYLNEAFDLIRQHYPLEMVLKFMDKSQYNDGKNFQIGVITFLSENPDKLDKVFKGDNEYKYFDKVLATNYHVLESMCKTDKEIDEVIKACQYTDKYNEQYTSQVLLDFALEIINKTHTWGQNETILFQDLKQTNPKLNLPYNNTKLSLAKKYFNANISTKTILDLVKDA